MATGSISSQVSLTGTTNETTVNLNCTLSTGTYPTQLTLPSGTAITCLNNSNTVSAVEIYLSDSAGSNTYLLYSGNIPIWNTSTHAPGTKTFTGASATFTGTNLTAKALYLKIVKHSSTVTVAIPKTTGITITTVTPTAVGAPTAVTPSRGSRYNYSVSWSGATNGTANTINGYNVLINTSASTSGATSIYTGTATSKSGSVTAGGTYYFGVRSQGTAGSSYYSGYKWSSGLVIPSKPSVSAGTVITDTQMDNLRTFINTSGITDIADGAQVKASEGNTYRSGLTAGTSTIDASWYNAAATG